jgi:hypothetical protein
VNSHIIVIMTISLFGVLPLRGALDKQLSVEGLTKAPAVTCSWLHCVYQAAVGKPYICGSLTLPIPIRRRAHSSLRCCSSLHVSHTSSVSATTAVVLTHVLPPAPMRTAVINKADIACRYSRALSLASGHSRTVASQNSPCTSSYTPLPCSSMRRGMWTACDAWRRLLDTKLMLCFSAHPQHYHCPTCVPTAPSPPCLLVYHRPLRHLCQV